VALTVPFSTTYSDDVFLPGSDSASKLGEFIMQAASPDYFKSLGTRILQGRAFDAQDRQGAPLVTIVSKAMAEGLWPGQDAIGKCIKTSADTSPCRTVVGVAENVKFGGFAEEWNLFTYLPEAQLGPNSYSYFVRTRGDASAASEGLRRALQSEMPGSSYISARVMSDVVAPAMRSWQLGATMFAVFGGLALALAAIGLYSVVAHSVVQRTHEMGVRVALGARSRNVIGMIVRESLRVVVVGVVLGAAVALAAGRWVAPLLYQVSPYDPLVLGGVALLLTVVAVIASWFPALRASRVAPNVALRSD
jgi:predicted lysophospholipase L1 biosynthesis ABC-type transport system permease subunit